MFISDDELITTVMEKAPDAYTGILVTETRIQGGNSTIDDFEEAMDSQFRIVIGVKSSEKSGKKGRELTLAAFSGKYFICCEEGHKVENYPKEY